MRASGIHPSHWLTGVFSGFVARHNGLLLIWRCKLSFLTIRISQLSAFLVWICTVIGGQVNLMCIRAYGTGDCGIASRGKQYHENMVKSLPTMSMTELRAETKNMVGDRENGMNDKA